MIQLIVSTRKRVTKHFGSGRFHKHKKMYLMCFFCIAINANIQRPTATIRILCRVVLEYMCKV
jgi:hypothetical protein